MFLLTLWVDWNHQEPHHETPVLNNSNWGGIRTGMILKGFEGFKDIKCIQLYKRLENYIMKNNRELYNGKYMTDSS